MRILLTVVGLLLLSMGVIWFLQGINVLPGSFMTGQIKWAVNGGIAAVVGLILIVVANRRVRKKELIQP
jgi:membrane protein implicated in regulation of membrane protease activity